MNFEFIKPLPQFGTLYEACRNAEALALPMPGLSCGASRTALEFIVHLIYRSVVGDCSGLSLFEMTTDERFVKYINDETVIDAIHIVRKNGNCGAHGDQLTPRVACQTLEQLHYLVGETLMNLGVIDDYPAFISPLKALSNKQKPHAPASTANAQPTAPLPSTPVQPAIPAPKPEPTSVATAQPAQVCLPSDEVVAEFAETLRRTKFHTSKNRNERENRDLFLQASLREAGWPIALNENQVHPESASINMALEDGSTIDYVLCGRDNRPLAVISYSYGDQSPIANRSQAVHAANFMENKYGYRPTIYYTGGYRIFCIDPLGFPPRRVFGFHTIDELELIKQRATSREDISNPVISDDITNRPYQKDAIRSVCQAFQNNRRRSVIVMATGTGKTRVSISLVDVLLRAGWVKNVLFLADRISLVHQAHKNFNKLLPSVTTSIFSSQSTNRDKNARVIFSTYKTMLNMVDGDTREFGIGRFDLIIIDEAHRSIFGKYKSLFDYFDALMVGLTATPRCEEFKSTFELFDTPNGPDYAYELEEAIRDGHLVPFEVLDRTTQAMKRGICYDDLSPEEKEHVENQMGLSSSEDTSPARLAGTVIKPDQTTINKPTIDLMLNDLMKSGLKVDAGDKLGKTIIFAKSHLEASIIVDRFNTLYPNAGADFCKLIDNQVDGSLQLIENLGERDNMPQIAVSVDMLDTGVDVPDVLNLVFFKSTRSKIKFLQMVGRGTRLSKDIFGPGVDKAGFLCFDYYDNFRFFSTTGTWSTADGIDTNNWAQGSQSSYVNNLKLSILLQLQDKKDLSPFEKQYRDELHDYFAFSIANLNNDAIDVDHNIAYVNKYREEDRLKRLTKEDAEEFRIYILPLIPSESAPVRVRSFDALILKVEVEYMQRVADGKDPAKIRQGFVSVGKAFTDRMKALQKLKTIPEVMEKENLISAMMDGDYLLSAFSFERAEYVRKELRDLMRYIPDSTEYYIFDLPDQLITGDEHESFGQARSYTDQVNEYLQDESNVALSKLRTLDPLTDADLTELEQALTVKLGTGADFAAWSGTAWSDRTKALAFLRKQVGIADEAIQTKLGSILNDPTLAGPQKAYLGQVVAYAKANGDITSTTLTKESPFIDIDLMQLFGQEKFPMLKTVVAGLHKPISE